MTTTTSATGRPCIGNWAHTGCGSQRRNEFFADDHASTLCDYCKDWLIKNNTVVFSNEEKQRILVNRANLQADHYATKTPARRQIYEKRTQRKAATLERLIQAMINELCSGKSYEDIRLKDICEQAQTSASNPSTTHFPGRDSKRELWLLAQDRIASEVNGDA